MGKYKIKVKVEIVETDDLEVGHTKYQAAKLNKPVSDFGTVICLCRQVP